MIPGERALDRTFDTTAASKKYTNAVGYYNTFIDFERKRYVASKKPPDLFLPPPTPEQKVVIKQLKESINQTANNELHITLLRSAAGAGKSHVLKYIERYLVQKQVEYAFVAPTASAASILPQGQTLHSFLGLFNVKSLPEKLVRDRVPKKRREKIKSLQLLICDEASMLGLSTLSLAIKRIKWIKKDNIV